MSVCITEVDYIYMNSGFYRTKFIVCNIELLVICGSTFIPILPPSRVHLDGGGGVVKRRRWGCAAEWKVSQ